MISFDVELIATQGEMEEMCCFRGRASSTVAQGCDLSNVDHRSSPRKLPSTVPHGKLAEMRIGITWLELETGINPTSDFQFAL